MASTKDLKKRIGTVRNTQQTTKAMKMVSAAKLRRAQDAIQNNRPYAKQMTGLIQLVSSLSDAPVQSPFVSREQLDLSAKKKVLVVLVTSDRGLCGAFNGNVIKMASRWVLANQAQFDIQLGFVGRKGFEFFRSRKIPQGPYFSEAGGKVSFAKAKKVADTLVDLYLTGAVDEVKVIYNEFKNAVTQQTVLENFLPLQAEVAAVSDKATAPVMEPAVYFVKPSQPEVLEQLLKKTFPVQIFKIMLESQAGEHGARMSAMENATKNAGEMIKKLTLQYNKQRQAGITKELLEIISGSESQKTS